VRDDCSFGFELGSLAVAKFELSLLAACLDLPKPQDDLLRVSNR
jgi:hypothetical protein